jgi:hypothetical protein
MQTASTSAAEKTVSGNEVWVAEGYCAPTAASRDPSLSQMTAS